ncbi:MAG TPA: hypothetical protein VFK03_04140, partial [Candidatus Saccharimonadales bacterium]|nr:hypothetical protein [Candidatus Saccharimonadales bacterium]
VSTGAQTWAGAKTFNALLTGNAGITVTGGAVSLTGNAASTLATTSGALNLQGDGGVNVTTTNKAGAATNNISVTSGNVTSGAFASGNVAIDVGTSTGTTGVVQIGINNASGITLGRNGITVANQGAETIAQTLTVTGQINANGGISVANGQNITFAGATGNFNQSASSGTFQTGTGAVSLNGDTTVASGKNFLQNGAGTFTTGSGANQLNGNTLIAGTATFTVNNGNTSLGANLDVTSSVAYKHGVDVATTGALTDLNVGNVSLIRLTGASAQTLNSIANGRDGYTLTIVNAAGQAATISDETGATAANRIRTGTGAAISLAPNGSITLVYDSQASRWRVVGDVAGGAGNAVTSIGTFTSCTSFANGGQISAGVLTFSCADITNPGMVSTGAQTWAGAKTFNALLTGNAGITVTGGAVSLTGNAASTVATTSGALNLQGDGGVNVTTTNKAGAATNNISIISGNVTSGAFTSGNVAIDVGTSTGTTGVVQIGINNASGITLGRNGITVANLGAETIAQTLTVTGQINANGGISIANGQNITFAGATGNFNQSASSGTFQTGTGAVSLNGDTTIASGKNFVQNGTGTFSTGSGANQLNGNTLIAGTATFSVNGGNTSLGANLDVTSSVAYKHGVDVSTTGALTDLNVGNVSLIRLTGASAQTLNSIANGRDGYV